MVTFTLRCVCTHEELIEALQATLGVEFRAALRGWIAETYGGSSLALKEEGRGLYSLTAREDVRHPLHANEERVFGRLADLGNWLTETLKARGVECTEVSTDP